MYMLSIGYMNITLIRGVGLISLLLSLMFSSPLSCQLYTYVQYITYPKYLCIHLDTCCAFEGFVILLYTKQELSNHSYNKYFYNYDNVSLNLIQIQ